MRSIRTNLFSLLMGSLLMGMGSTSLHSDEESQVQFSRDIRPLLSDHCFACHGPDKKHRKAGLRLDLESVALGKHKGRHVIKAGDLDASEVWKRISSTDPDEVMPPPGFKKPLSAKQKSVLKNWIAQGAKWQGHWSFVTPVAPKVPDVKFEGWPKNPIDSFILARLEKESLKPSPEATREELIRRVTFDFTGLPPTLEEIDAFVNDQSPNAYEKVVDRLLKNSSFGERMALAWMDAGRYGDTSVYHADGPREMWHWRDWTIRAYNENKSFKDFTVEQIAGDQIPNATIDQQIASGFNRNHGTTDEGGAIDEEYRVEYIVDRVKTTANVWLGMSFECAQCHSHKYDPFSQKEYYQFYAFFNQSADRGMQTRNGNADPKISIPNREAESEIKKIRGQLQGLDQRLKQHLTSVQPAFDAWTQKAASKVKGKKIQAPAGLVAHFDLNEKKGRKTKNEIDKKLNGSIKGKVKWADGKLAGAFQFDGGNFIDCGQIGDFERTDSFSFGAWVYQDNAKQSGAFLARMDDNGGHRGYDLLNNGGKIAVHIISKWPTDAIKVVTNKEIKSKTWTHIFMTYDGSSDAKGIKIYIDGKEEPWKIEQNQLKNSIRTKVPLYLGSRNPGSKLRGRLDDVRIYPRKLSAAEVKSLAGNDVISPILALDPKERKPDQVETLKSHYLNSIDKTYIGINKEKASLNNRISQLSKPIGSVMVMRDVPKPRMTYILNRGSYDSPLKDQPVNPETPAFLPPMAKGLAKNRLGLAKWMVQDDHPLTSRVAVNRYWQILFGTGIVKTVQDFGSQGEWPSHPQLLDWLATDFVKNGWDIKRTLKQMVMSATYRQSSKISKKLWEHDPGNQLLARGPRFRLQGEFIRDNALKVSGLLVDKVGGPGVKPYQPPGLWNEVSLSGNVRFRQDKGEKLYRKSMYIYWKRSAPMPAMMIFDAPTREKCTVQRQRTNTPLQALVTLNDVQFVEASRAFAQRILLTGGDSDEKKLTFAYRLATGRTPTAYGLKVLKDFISSQRETYKKSPEKAKELITVGESKRDESLPAEEHAAWTQVGSLLLNLDATLTRG